MRKYLVVTEQMDLDTQRERNMLNMVFDKMRELGRFNENEVKNFLLRQTDFNTSGGFYFSYDKALSYYNEMVK